MNGVDSIAHMIQVALTPVFLLSGIASLLGVFSGRLARVADRVDTLSERVETCSPSELPRLRRRLDWLRRRSHALDVAVVMGAAGGIATCVAALVLFVGTLREETVASGLFASFGLGLICTAGALAAFLTEMLMASRGIRDKASQSVEADVPTDCEPGDPPDRSDPAPDTPTSSA